MIPTIFGKTFLQRALLALIAASSLGGCFDSGSGGNNAADGAVAPPASGTDSPALPEPANQPPEVDGIPAAAVTVGEAYSFKPEAIDADDDFLEYIITNKPSWATFDSETGTLTGTPTTANIGESEDITISVTDGRDTRSIGPFKIKVNERPQPPNAPPTISGTPATSVMVNQEYLFSPTYSDPEGDRLRFLISNRPSWATFSTANGQLRGTPTEANATTFSNIRISVSDGTNTVTLPAFSIQVRGINQAPVISGTPGTTAQVGAQYTFTPVASDPEDDTLVFKINNLPRWASLNAQTGVLSGTPGAADIGTYSKLIISVSDGRTTTALPAFSIVVGAAPTPNRAPTISGTPATSGTVGAAYSFKPTATDPDGNTLAFAIENRPSWATFNTSTGALTGTPTAAGTFANIRITVRDSSLSASLPVFSITVGSGNRAPTITGTPAKTATTGSAYSFRPTGSDPDGNTLTYSISNRPSWATFNASTGQLSGTPTAANAGTYSNIVISVSDGTLSASLASFSITVVQSSSGSATLSWTPPTQNTDGSSLSNLAGYRIVYGRTASSLDQTVQVANAGTSGYTVTGLSSGTWYFRVKAYNSSGAESDVSNAGSKTIP
jgi:hypothetical protein